MPFIIAVPSAHPCGVSLRLRIAQCAALKPCTP
uniref:Uncharacterized protein n=1 Tax=Arundo donax TaxID=35708 RepID=A0A0A9CCL4_ARUDO